MNNIFTTKYCDDIYDISQIRNSPLTNDELKEVLPYKEDRSKYLNLLKELYMEALLFNAQRDLQICSSKDYTNQLKKKYIELLDFCLLNNMIDRDVYSELGGGQKGWDNKYMPMGHLITRVYSKTPFPLISELETLEEYSVRIEENLAVRESSWYLDLRYNFSECFSENNGENLYYYNSKNETLDVADGKNIISLWQKINNDISNLRTKIADIEIVAYDTTRTEHTYSEQKDAFKRRREFYKELSYLCECFDIVEPYYNEVKDNKELICNKEEILYIYKGTIKCHKQKHNIVQATAICYGRDDNEIELNVEYCSDCKKYLLEYNLFERYRNRYGILIGNFRMTNHGVFSGEYDLALESPLKLSGYSVSQKDGFSSITRQRILARIIHNNIMSKGEVIKYLSYFIRMQGSKYGNEIALEKWEDDLRFVQDYNKEIQPKTYISKIKKY